MYHFRPPSSLNIHNHCTLPTQHIYGFLVTQDEQCFPKSINRLVCVTQKQWLVCEAGTVFLNIIRKTFRLQTVNKVYQLVPSPIIIDKFRLQLL